MSDPNAEKIRKIAKVIGENQRFLVASHVRPDGDAIGSLLSLTFMLRRLGKDVSPHTQDPVPPGYEFLPGAQGIIHQPPQPFQHDVAILVDCGDFQRVGPALTDSIARIPFLINIDHHFGNSPFGNISWVDSSASSTCEMLYDLCLGLSLTPDPEIATQLYTGLVTDTGSFRFSNTNQRVLEIAAALVAAGAQPSYIAQQIFDSASPERLLLLAQVLSTITFYENNRLATAELTQKMFKETGTTPMDGDGFINHLRSVKSVELAMLFREGPDGMVHVSMRSKGKVDVATFAQTYGGGGHRQAAAFRLPGELHAIRSRCTSEALEYTKNV